MTWRLYRLPSPRGFHGMVEESASAMDTARSSCRSRRQVAQSAFVQARPSSMSPVRGQPLTKAGAPNAPPTKGLWWRWRFLPDPLAWVDSLAWTGYYSHLQMNICSTISVVELAGSTELAGAAAGAEWLQAARFKIDRLEPGLCVVDFDGIRLATVSWLREALVALLRYTAAMRPGIVLLAANLTELVREEVRVALEATGNVMLAADLSGGDIHSPVIMGRLDPALSETLFAISGEREFDASNVTRAISHVGPSAASNRLAALESKGMLKSERRGRTRVYRLVLEGLRYGH